VFNTEQETNSTRQTAGGTMADTTNIHELLATTFATADALAKLLIEKRLITQAEFMGKLSAERATYQKLLNPTRQ
jgi:hypothetical protein